MARYKNTVTLGDAIKEFLAEYKHSSKLTDAQAIRAWPEVMGPNIAAYTVGVYMKSGKLFVSLKSSVLRNELMMSKGKIVNALNHHLGSDVIKDVVLK